MPHNHQVAIQTLATGQTDPRDMAVLPFNASDLRIQANLYAMARCSASKNLDRGSPATPREHTGKRFEDDDVLMVRDQHGRSLRARYTRRRSPRPDRHPQLGHHLVHVRPGPKGVHAG